MKLTQQVSVLYAVYRWAVHGVLWIAVFLQQHKCKNHISNVLYVCVCVCVWLCKYVHDGFCGVSTTLSLSNQGLKFAIITTSPIDY